MSSKQAVTKLDAINNRILVRNSHKFVYKKLCSVNRDEWCQKYLSVATSKLLDPKSTTKLPFSLNKKPRIQDTIHSTSNSSFAFQHHKIQVLAINENEDLSKSRTLDNDALIKASRKAQRLLERMKQTVCKPLAKGGGTKTRYQFRSPLKSKSKD